MFELADLLAGLQLEDAGDGRFHAPNMDFYGKNSSAPRRRPWLTSSPEVSS